MNVVGIDPGRTNDYYAVIGIYKDDKGIIRTAKEEFTKNMPLDWCARMLVRPIVEVGRASHVVVETNGIIGKNAYRALQQEGIPNLRPVHTTSNMSADARLHNHKAVDKTYMMQWLKTKFEAGMLRMASPHQQLKAQLEDIHRYTTPSGQTTYKAQKGRHDDLVMALVMACHIFALQEQITAMGGHIDL